MEPTQRAELEKFVLVSVDINSDEMKASSSYEHIQKVTTLGMNHL